MSNRLSCTTGLSPGPDIHALVTSGGLTGTGVREAAPYCLPIGVKFAPPDLHLGVIVGRSFLSWENMHFIWLVKAPDLLGVTSDSQMQGLGRGDRWCLDMKVTCR